MEGIFRGGKLGRGKLKGGKLGRTFWTAKALFTGKDDEAVVNTHLEYLNAGADIIETATYQATSRGLQEGLGISSEESETFIEKAVVLADRGLTRFIELKADIEWTRNICPLIAGSIGPYGVYLHDGSEYTGNYMDKVDEKEIISVHDKRLEILGKHSRVDLLAIETMPSLMEVEILLRLMKEKGIQKPVWVSFMLKENDPSKTARGESVVEAFKSVLKFANIWGFGANCIDPKIANEFLKIVSAAKRDAGTKGENIRLVIYPNVGKKWTSGEGWSNEPVPDLSTYAKDWIKNGANVIGGCCQVGPDQILKLGSIIKEIQN